MNSFSALATLVAATVAMGPGTAMADEAFQSTRVSADIASANMQINAGRMLYATNGQRVAPIYRVNPDGNPQVILNGELITIPLTSLSEVGGKVTTSLSNAQLNRVQ